MAVVVAGCVIYFVEEGRCFVGRKYDSRGVGSGYMLGIYRTASVDGRGKRTFKYVDVVPALYEYAERWRIKRLSRSWGTRSSY